MRIFIAIFLLLSCAASSFSQTVDPTQLEQLKLDEAAAQERADALKKKQDAIRKQISNYKEELKSTSSEVATIEKTNSDISAQLSTLEQDEAALKISLNDKKLSLMQTLAALQRLELTPPPSIAATSKSITESVITSNLMGSVSEQLSERAEDIKLKLAELGNIKTKIEDRQTALSKSERALLNKQSKIKSVVAEKSKLDDSLGASRAKEKERARRLAQQAKDLRELISRFEKSAADIVPRIKPSKDSANISPSLKPNNGASKPQLLKLPKGTRRFADARAGLIPPVRGRLKSGYGGGRQGLTISTASRAQVVAPFPGRVEFAGTFKTYGEVVILNVGENYFILLTGLGEIFVSSGEMVDASEPLGLMPFKTRSTSELYIEFRKSGRTINPNPWLGKAY